MQKSGFLMTRLISNMMLDVTFMTSILVAEVKRPLNLDTFEHPILLISSHVSFVFTRTDVIHIGVLTDLHFSLAFNLGKRLSAFGVIDCNIVSSDDLDVCGVFNVRWRKGFF